MRHAAFHCLFAFLLAPGGDAAQAEMRLGLGIQASVINNSSDDPREIDKKGFGAAGTFGVSWLLADASVFSLGLGVEQRNVRGASDSYKQELKMLSGFFSSSYRWLLGPIELGPRLGLTRGKAASLRAADAETTRTVAAIGPEVAYRLPLGTGDGLITLALLRDLAVADQATLSFCAGLQFWLGDATPPGSDNL